MISEATLFSSVIKKAMKSLFLTMTVCLYWVKPEKGIALLPTNKRKRSKMTKQLMYLLFL